MVRKRKILALFLNLVTIWQEFECRAEISFGSGEEQEIIELPTFLTDAENPDQHQLSELSEILKNHRNRMQVLMHEASTRLIDDGGLYV